MPNFARISFARLFITGLLFTFLPLQALASVECDDRKGLICIEAVETETGFTIFGINRYPHLTASLVLKLELENLRASTGLKGTLVVPNNTRIKLGELSFKNKGAWRYDYQMKWISGDINARHTNSYAYRLPYRIGQAHLLTQGCNGKYTHKGDQKYAYDFQMPVGTKIYAAREGRIIDKKEDSNKRGTTEAYQNDGNYVVVEHNDATLAIYGHLRKNGVSVRVGQHVSRGAHLGYSGNTGQSSAPHLHFSVVKAGRNATSQTIKIALKTATGSLRCPRPGSQLVAVE